LEALDKQKLPSDDLRWTINSGVQTWSHLPKLVQESQKYLKDWEQLEQSNDCLSFEGNLPVPAAPFSGNAANPLPRKPVLDQEISGETVSKTNISRSILRVLNQISGSCQILDTFSIENPQYETVFFSSGISRLCLQSLSSTPKRR
jgi:hypothetical protein